MSETTTPIPGQELITSFTSFFGDSFNGLFVTWGHDVYDTLGGKKMTMKLQANLYAAAKDNFLFGQTKFPTTNDDKARTISKIVPSPAGTGGVSWDYCSSVGAPTYTALADLVPPNVETEDNDAKLDAACAPDYTTLGKRVAGVTALDSAAMETTNREWSVTKDMKLAVIWANPDTTCPNICYDGVSALVTQTLTVGYYRPLEIQLGAAVTTPSVKVTWKKQRINDAVAPLDNSVFYDIKPVSKYDSDDTVRDSNRDDPLNDAFATVEDENTQLCKEQWVYGDTFVACVKIEGNLTRLFKTLETSNPPDDLEWSYIKFKMHALVGVYDKTVTQNDALLFPEQDVDFNTFNMPLFAIHGLRDVRSLLIGTAIGMLLF
jgi:hypothetical protein